MEITNAIDNKRLIVEKNERKRKENLIEIKQDFIEELKLLGDVKVKQAIEVNRYKKRREAYNVLTHQIDENNMKLIKDREEKDKEIKQMHVHYQRLLDDEAKDREVQHERKLNLREELDSANKVMMEHKE